MNPYKFKNMFQKLVLTVLVLSSTLLANSLNDSSDYAKPIKNLDDITDPYTITLLNSIKIRYEDLLRSIKKGNVIMSETLGIFQQDGDFYSIKSLPLVYISLRYQNSTNDAKKEAMHFLNEWYKNVDKQVKENTMKVSIMKHDSIFMANANFNPIAIRKFYLDEIEKLLLKELKSGSYQTKIYSAICLDSIYNNSIQPNDIFKILQDYMLGTNFNEFQTENQKFGTEEGELIYTEQNQKFIIHDVFTHGLKRYPKKTINIFKQINENNLPTKDMLYQYIHRNYFISKSLREDKSLLLDVYLSDQDLRKDLEQFVNNLDLNEVMKRLK